MLFFYIPSFKFTLNFSSISLYSGFLLIPFPFLVILFIPFSFYTHHSFSFLPFPTLIYLVFTLNHFLSSPFPPPPSSSSFILLPFSTLSPCLPTSFLTPFYTPLSYPLHISSLHISSILRFIHVLLDHPLPFEPRYKAAHSQASDHPCHCNYIMG